MSSRKVCLVSLYMIVSNAPGHVSLGLSGMALYDFNDSHASVNCCRIGSCWGYVQDVVPVVLMFVKGELQYIIDG